jgi:hypothetical protein
MWPILKFRFDVIVSMEQGMGWKTPLVTVRLYEWLV